MTPRTAILFGLLILGAVHSAAAPPPIRRLVVTVVNAHTSPPQPVANVRVSLSYFADSRKITDARDRTNRRGQTELLVSSEAQEQGEMRIEIWDASDLVIYQPPEGRFQTVPSTPLNLVLLPKGSPLLLEPAKIEAMLDRLSRLSMQNQRLRLSLTKLENQPPDFDRALRDWAASNGFAYAEVDNRVRAWANEMLAHRERASLNHQAEAELGLRHFESAARLFAAAADESHAELQEGQKEFLEHQRELLRKVVQLSSQAASGYLLARKFSEATSRMDSARADASAVHQQFRGDAPLREIWLWASIVAEGTRLQEGRQFLDSSRSVTNSQQILSQVVANCRELLGQMNEKRDAEKEAWTEMMLLGGLLFAGEITPSAQAEEFRKEAVATARSAVKHISKEQDPEQWANMQIILGLVEGAQVARQVTDGSISVGYAAAIPVAKATLDESLAALNAALDVFDQKNHPKEWGTAKATIANFLALKALFAMARHADSEKAALLKQAEAADRSALDALTKDQYGHEWAETQDSLGGILLQEAESESPPRSLELSRQAELAYRAALAIRTKQDGPMGWANTQDKLAGLLKSRALLVTRPESIGLFRDSVALMREESDVITRSGFPQRWARLQDTLGGTLAMLGVRQTGSDAAGTLMEAAQAYKNALEVFTREEYPQRWAWAEKALGTVLTAESSFARSDESHEVLAAAVTAEQNALEVFKQQTYPEEWAGTKANLGWALATLSSHEPANARELLGHAAEAYRAALLVYTKELYPHDWINAQGALAEILVREGRATPDGAASEYFREAASRYEAILAGNLNQAAALSASLSLYHDYLLDFPRAWELAARLAAADPTDDNRLNLAEAALTTSRFGDCIESVGGTTQARISPTLLPARQILLLACQWGAGQRAAAAETARSVGALAAQTVQGGWNTTGDRQYLSAAPEFAGDKAAWIKLFRGLAEGDGTFLADAARQLRAAIEK
jgi:hypothetical protein